MFWTYQGTQSQIKAQMHLARSERQQRRQEESYAALLLLVAEADDWAYQLMLNPPATWNDKPYPYPPKIYQRTLSTQGVLSMYWSPRMRQLVAELQGHMTTAFQAWVGQQAALSSLDASGTPQPSVVTTLEAFMAAKEAISETAERIKDQAGDELGDRHTGDAEEHPS